MRVLLFGKILFYFMPRSTFVCMCSLARSFHYMLKERFYIINGHVLPLLFHLAGSKLCTFQEIKKKGGNPLIDTVEEGCTLSSPFLPALSCSFEYPERLSILQWRRHCNCIASIWNSKEKAILQSALPPPKFSSLFLPFLEFV